jgi:hypothetical protein
VGACSSYVRVNILFFSSVFLISVSLFDSMCPTDMTRTQKFSCLPGSAVFFKRGGDIQLHMKMFCVSCEGKSIVVCNAVSSTLLSFLSLLLEFQMVYALQYLSECNLTCY